MRQLELTQGQFALVDDGDFEDLSKRNWYAILIKRTGNYYAASMSRDENGKRMTLRMHCVILGVKGVDHKDGNGLNNQRYNLRPANTRQNNYNAGKTKKDSSSKYKGVYVRKEYKGIAYRAQIMHNYTKIMLGTFSSEVEAALAYDVKSKELFGEFARLNFPEEING